MSLMERLNKALRKDNESTRQLTAEDMFPSSSLKFGAAEVETESDNDSDFDDDISPTECAKIAAKNKNKHQISSKETLETSSSLKPSIGQNLTESSSKVLNYDMYDATQDQWTSSNASKNNETNTIPSKSQVSTHNTVSFDLPAFASSNYRNNRILIDTELPEKPSAKKLLSTTSAEDVLPPLSFCQTETGTTKSTTKKSKTERDAEREQKRKAKEAEKLAKQQEKQRKQEEKESKKKAMEMEKASKKAASMQLKTESVDQCLKYVTTVLDSNILNDGGGSILQALDTLGVQYEIKKLPVDATVGWMRDNVDFKVEDNCQIKRVSNYQEENTVLMRLKAEEFARMIKAQNEQSTRSTCSSSGTIYERISQVESLLPNKKLTILVTGLNSYMKTMKAKASSKKNPMPQISKIDIEEVLLRLQLQFNYCVHFCETPEDLAQMVASFTKAVAEKPYKKVAGAVFDIYMNNHDKSLPRVTKEGQGLLEVWSKQIQQFKGVGHDTAAAIVQQYPSPSILMQEYENCATQQEARMLLQDIEVRRGHGVLATSRRVGPELSKKIHKLLTSVDGDAELAKS